jgi:hypothetical protein
MEERSDFGSHQGREVVAHKYYPLLFPEVYYFTLLMHSEYKIDYYFTLLMHSEYKIIKDTYGIRNDFCIFTNLLMSK